jgi:hypothetical protein
MSACDYCHYSPNFNTTNHQTKSSPGSQFNSAVALWHTNFSKRTKNRAFWHQIETWTKDKKQKPRAHSLLYHIFQSGARGLFCSARPSFKPLLQAYNKDRWQEMIRRAKYIRAAYCRVALAHVWTHHHEYRDGIFRLFFWVKKTTIFDCFQT